MQHVLVVSIFLTDVPDAPSPTHLVSCVQQIKSPPSPTPASLPSLERLSAGRTSSSRRNTCRSFVFAGRRRAEILSICRPSSRACNTRDRSTLTLRASCGRSTSSRQRRTRREAMEGVDELLARSLRSLPTQVKLCVQVRFLPSDSSHLPS
jgi:hypothetical protein